METQATGIECKARRDNEVKLGLNSSPLASSLHGKASYLNAWRDAGGIGNPLRSCLSCIDTRVRWWWWGVFVDDVGACWSPSDLCGWHKAPVDLWDSASSLRPANTQTRTRVQEVDNKATSDLKRLTYIYLLLSFTTFLQTLCLIHEKEPVGATRAWRSSPFLCFLCLKSVLSDWLKMPGRSTEQPRRAFCTHSCELLQRREIQEFLNFICKVLWVSFCIYFPFY